MNMTMEQQIKDIDCSPSKKYTRWLLKQYNLEQFNLEIIKNYVEEYQALSNRNLINCDIYSFKNINDFIDNIDKVNSIKSATRKEEENDYDIILENDDLIIIRPNTHAASRKLGLTVFKYRTNTKTGKQDSAWCTTYANSSHWDSYYYKKYLTFYYIKFKNLDNIDERLQVIACTVKNESNPIINVYDRDDVLVNNHDFLNENDILKYIVPYQVIERGMKKHNELFKLLNQEIIDGDLMIDWDIFSLMNIDYNYTCKLVKGSVYLKGGFTKIPKFLKKVTITGSFDCSNNKIKSLENSPTNVGYSYFCHFNELTSLEGVPKQIKKNFKCNVNKLTSLIGAPENVGGSFDCCNNFLTSLTGAPKFISIDFSCHSNKLITLNGIPEHIGKYLDISQNELEEIDFFPSFLGDSFFCHMNKLIKLSNLPKTINGFFKCNHNELTSLEGAPDTINGDFDVSYNKINFIDYKLEIKINGVIYIKNSHQPFDGETINFNQLIDDVDIPKSKRYYPHIPSKIIWQNIL